MRDLVSLAAALLAAGCQQQQQPADANITVGDQPEQPGDTPPVDTPSTAPPPPEANAVDPNVPPPPHVDHDAPPIADEKTALGAARRLQEYCDAVATRRYRDAYGYWNDNGRATGMTFAQFRDSFAKYRAYDCHILKPGEMEGAAGSLYVTIPLRVTGALTRGGGFTLEGPVTMRRVNDVDGSTAEQRRWHISQSGLKPRP